MFCLKTLGPVLILDMRYLFLSDGVIVHFGDWATIKRMS